MSGIDEALGRSRQLIQDALAEVRTELAELDAHRNELLAKIAEAEAILAGPPQNQPHTPGAAGASALTLHEALTRVLEDRGNEGMTARELAEEVNRRALYRRRDGSPVEVNQVHARTNNYRALFEKDGPNIRLRKGAT